MGELVREFVNYEYDKVLYEGKVFDSQQYLINTISKLSTMEIEYKALLNCIREMDEKSGERRKNIIQKMNANKTISIDELWNENIEYFGVPLPFYTVIQRIVSNFFHNAHCYFDSIAQYINASLLGRFSVKSDDINFSSLQNHLKKNYLNEYQHIVKKMQEMKKSPNFTYIADFNNTVKHIQDISTIINPDNLRNGMSLKIPAFSKYNRGTKKTNAYQRQDLLEKMKEILIELIEKGREVFTLIKQKVSSINPKFNSNRIHTLNFGFKALEDKDRVLHGALTLIKYQTDKEVIHNEEFGVLLCKDEGFKVHLTNCPYENILIYNLNNENIGILEATDLRSEDSFGPFYYRKYKVNLNKDENKIYEHGTKAHPINTKFMNISL